MEMYNIIADNYSSIFPLGEERISFVKSCLNPGDSFLDIGCSTGDLCIELAKAGYKAVGIDLNSRMIEIAGKKAVENTDFRVMNMLDIDKQFENISFPLITCFSNTLPHLDSLSEIKYFFKQVYSRLTSTGCFVFQILDYDKILMKRKCDFPEIKNPDFVFNRKYEFVGDKIRFTIEMERGDKIMSDSTLLYPLIKDQAISALQEAGFNEIHCYSDYSLKPSNGKESAALYVAQK
ncbi:MAG: class I SAM-dependent methyltransferase [Candidatus Atribacteria bacterium]|nr:class I SAM-dependent methyltransferase [Candidatus Atribacteria bacterium]